MLQLVPVSGIVFWEATVAVATVVLAVVTVVYARLTFHAVTAAQAAAEQSERAADAAATAAAATQRQADSMERSERWARMPLVHTLSYKAAPALHFGETVLAKVTAKNLGKGPALNQTFQVLHDQLRGQPVNLPKPLLPGGSADLGRMAYPIETTEIGLFEIEARYQDHEGTTYLSKTDAWGSLKVFIVDDITGEYQQIFGPTQA